MEQMLNDIIAFLLPRNDFFLYGFLFASAVIENLFPPIPGDTITAFGAFLVGTGRLGYLPVYLATTTGSVCGFMVLVLVGHLLEREFFMKKNYRFFSAESIVSAEQWFARYGYFVVLANRFLPGIRSVISLVSGISRLRLWYVLLLATVSASIWNLIWIQVGFLLGNNWDTVKEQAGTILRRYNIAAGIVMTVIIAGYIIFRVIRSRHKSPINKK
jgi:membrane protein DedA with SNARE-associated domain